MTETKRTGNTGKAVLSSLGLATMMLATPASAQITPASEDYGQHVLDCIDAFFNDHPLYEEFCTPGPGLSISSTKGGTQEEMRYEPPYEPPYECPYDNEPWLCEE
jgi:hypothetical protein